ISGSLYQALTHESERDAAVIAFLVTASGLTLMGIGSAFWGLIVRFSRRLRQASSRLAPASRFVPAQRLPSLAAQPSWWSLSASRL
ncbi:benzoate/H(+) symporter BenE family transporter, partial [Salmonella enterica subsp. enterica serovar Anatum]|nr:benzoate/H(+) symporter BenE family transporter [Salmonella enterica subsp. enterica serovar Anatum]